jgi:hypothetical protein
VKNYDKLVPHDSFMGRYLSFMSQQETAYAFDFWSGMWAISCACGRLTYVARPRAPVYLNMYTILIGESGIARKTTSVSMAAGLVRAITREDQELGFIDAKMTAEKLDSILHMRTVEHGSAQLCVAIPELAVFLGTEQYVANMPTLLTDLYDCPSHRYGGGTIARGEIIQRNVWLSFLSASTPVWLLKTVNPNVVEGGFTSRCLFIVSNEPKGKVPWPDEDASSEDRAILLQDLREIRKRALIEQPLTLTDGGMQAFTRWYRGRVRSVDAFLLSFEAREDAHVLRVAALLSINDGSWRIDQTHVSRSIRLIESVKEGSKDIFDSGDTRSRYALSLDKIRSILISAGMDPVPRNELIRKSKRRLSYNELVDLLEILHEVGAVQRFVSPPESGKGRPVEYFRGTNLILARGLGDEVLSKFG